MILGVSFDGQKANKRFHDRFSFNFPLLCDVDRTMGLAYGAARRPGRGGSAKRVGIIINPEGQIHHYDPSASAFRFPRTALKRL